MSITSRLSYLHAKLRDYAPGSKGWFYIAGLIKGLELAQRVEDTVEFELALAYLSEK